MSQQFTGLLDMFNGGGAGASGDTFEGGLLSGLWNALGIRPIGYGQQPEQAQPQAPAAPQAAPAAATIAPPQGVSTALSQHAAMADNRHAARIAALGQPAAPQPAPSPLPSLVAQQDVRDKTKQAENAAWISHILAQNAGIPSTANLLPRKGRF